MAADVLKAAAAGGEAGVHIMLVGPPGTGKTELAQTLAARAGVALFAAGESADEAGDEPTRSGRSAALPSGQQKERVNPCHLQSVRITAQHHALAGQVVRVVRRKRHRGEAYVVVEVKDGSRQLIAVRNTELADAQLSTPDLRFTPGSLRALVDVINDCRGRAERAGGEASASSKRLSGVGLVPAGGAPAGRGTLDRAAGASAVQHQRGKGRSTSR